MLSGLTFSVDEQEFGKVVTEELMPGGSFTPVTSSNKISYIHQIAHYKMYTQIHKQTKAFCAGETSSAFLDPDKEFHRNLQFIQTNEAYHALIINLLLYRIEP